MIKLEVRNAAVPKLKATQAELEATQAELEATQAELEATQTKLEASQSKLASFQSKLASSQVGQETSQAKLETSQAELETTQTELETSQKQVVQLRKQLQELKRLQQSKETRDLQQSKDTIDLSTPSPSDNTLRYPAWILLPMRIFLGLTFIYAGMQKLTDPQFFNSSMPGYIGTQIQGMAHGSPLHDFLMSVALPHAVLFGWLTLLGEIAVGLAVYAGFFFRPAAFVGMMLSLTFFLSATWNIYPYFFGSDIVFIFCWLTMILGGPLNTGLPSIDDWLVDQLLATGYTPQDLHPVLQLYILLVVAGAPHKSSYTAGISLLSTNPITGSLQSYRHKSSMIETEEMTRRTMIRDWTIGAVTVASITLLGIPLHIFGNNPNASAPQTTDNTPDTSVISDTAGTPSTPDTTSTAPTPDTSGTTSTPNTTSTTTTTTTSTTPIPVRLVSVGQSIAPVSAVPKNSTVKFLISTGSAQDAAILIHLPNGTLVAYDAVCTHLGCTVEYQQDTHLLTCDNCHGSHFDPAHKGAVLQGPATRPLSALGIHLDSATGAIKLISIPS